VSLTDYWIPFLGIEASALLFFTLFDVIKRMNETKNLQNKSKFCPLQCLKINASDIYRMFKLMFCYVEEHSHKEFPDEQAELLALLEGLLVRVVGRGDE